MVTSSQPSTPRNEPDDDFWVTRRNFIRIGGMGAAAAFLAACGANGTTTTAAPGTTAASGATGPMSNLASITIGDGNPNFASEWTYHTALSKGWLTEVGITEQKVIVTEEYVAGLIGKSLDIVRGDTDTLIGAAAASQSGLKMISFHNEAEWQIMGVRAGIETAEDLKGAKISGGDIGSRNDFIQRRIVAELGLDPDTDVEFVPTSGGSDSRLQALLAGSLDAASVFPRHRGALEGAGGKFLYEVSVPNPQEGYAAMEDWLAANGDAATAWLTAELRGRQYILDVDKNKDEVVEIMKGYGFDLPQDFIDAYADEAGDLSVDGGFNPVQLDTLMDEFKLLGFMDESVEWRDHVDMTYLWAAQDALGIPRRPDPSEL
ncbi:MAG: ABC transporter substrate-binding protein [Acidimicrobiia bacterium]|nr:ABC transporter substrate-binding protein [Acidimicrobiia bacterium]